MIFKKLIYDITLQFIEAFHARDFETMKSFLAKDVIFESPNITRLLAYKTEDKIQGSDETIDYLKLLAGMYPTFFFDNSKTEVIKEDRMVIMKGVLLHNNKPIEAHYFVNEYGKFLHVKIMYPEGFQ